NFNDWSAQTMLLPYLEQTQLFNALNFTQDPNNCNCLAADPTNVMNTTSYRIQIAGFLCPSDIDRLTNSDGHINYMGNAGSTAYSFTFASPFDGLFQIMQPAGVGAIATPVARPTGVVSLRDITDGLSQTAALSERVKGIGIRNNAATSFDLLKPSSS